MKKFFRNQKGINLISLTITVVVILIITNIVIYNVKDNLKTQRIKALQTDISNLRDKISTYYSQYGKIPANTEYTNTSGIDVISSAVDTGKFYVIDLSALDNLTLNYGTDYEKIKSGEVTDANILSDLYIINDDSHNIFYVDGVTLDNQTFYTDYTTKDVDTEAVDLKYIDGIKIPDGFYYVGGTKDTGLVISDAKDDDLNNSKGGNQFVWIPVENKKDYERNTNYSNTNVAENATSDTDYLPEGIDDEEKAVIDAGGFFVSRFEVGIESSVGPVSKKGMTVDSYVTQERAKTRAKSIVNTDSAKSALCSGTQWDLVMKFVDGKEGYLVNDPISDRHNPSGIDKTGANEKDKVCNIYDLEGNVFEYVADKSTVQPEYEPCIKRGGSYDNTIQASTYTSCNGKEDSSIAFRAVLYVIPSESWTKTYDKTGIYKDKNDDTATIPAGFQVSLVGSQNKITNGLVVRGPDESEFVWVPVDDINTMAQCSTAGGDCNLILSDGDELMCTTHNSTEIVGKLYATEWGENFGTVNTTYNENSGLREPAIVNGDSAKSLFSLESLKQDYKNMATSVAKYGGFYVGKYETSLSDATASSAGTSAMIQSKKGVIPVAVKDTVESTWYGLYKLHDKTYTKVSDLVESSMIWGSQYDAILNWAKKGIDSKKIADKSLLGNELGEEVETTGNSKSFKDSINNIKDLGGNLCECTLEAYDTEYRVHRSGDYQFDNSLVYRFVTALNMGYGTGGSRMTLYIK